MGEVEVVGHTVAAGVEGKNCIAVVVEERSLKGVEIGDYVILSDQQAETLDGVLARVVDRDKPVLRRRRDDGSLYSDNEGYRSYSSTEVIEIIGVGVGFSRMGKV